MLAASGRSVFAEVRFVSDFNKAAKHGGHTCMYILHEKNKIQHHRDVEICTPKDLEAGTDHPNFIFPVGSVFACEHDS